MDVRTIRLYTEFFAIGTSLSVNTLVLYLTLTESNKILHEYKRMIVASCVVDFILCLWSSFTVADSILEDNALLIIADGPYYYLPEQTQLYLPFWHLCLVGTGTTIVPFDFFYRYNLVCKSRTPSKKTLALVLLICWIPSALTGFIFQIAFYQNSTQPETSLHYRQIIERQSWIKDYGEVKAFVGSLFVGMIVIGIVYAVALYFGFKIYKQLQSMYFVSKKTRRLQTKMTVVLIVKAIFPFCLASTPAIVVISSMIFKFNFPDMGMWLAILTNLIPVAGPISTLLLLGNFKERLTQGVKKIFYTSSMQVEKTVVFE